MEALITGAVSPTRIVNRAIAQVIEIILTGIGRYFNIYVRKTTRIVMLKPDTAIK